MISDTNDVAETVIDCGTDTYNPEQLVVLREMLNTTLVAKTPEFRQTVLQLLGAKVAQCRARHGVLNRCNTV